MSKKNHKQERRKIWQFGMKLILCRVKSSETSELEEMRTEMSNRQSQANDRFEIEQNQRQIQKKAVVVLQKIIQM